MAKIIVNRKNELQQRLRRFSVFIDGEKVGEVRNGNPEEFAVSQGNHTVQCKFNWFSSKSYDISVRENDVKFLLVRANLPFFWPMYIILFAAILTPFFYRIATDSRDLPEGLQLFRAVIMVVVAIYFLFFMVIKRKTYLIITEDTKNIFNT